MSIYNKKGKNNNKKKKYEDKNIVDENSIYTSNNNSEDTIVEPKGQIYYSADILDKLFDKIDLLQKGQARLRRDLVKSGVLKTI